MRKIFNRLFYPYYWIFKELSSEGSNYAESALVQSSVIVGLLFALVVLLITNLLGFKLGESLTISSCIAIFGGGVFIWKMWNPWITQGGYQAIDSDFSTLSLGKKFAYWLGALAIIILTFQGLVYLA